MTVPLAVLRVAPEAADCPKVAAHVRPTRMGATFHDEWHAADGRDQTIEGWLVKVTDDYVVVVNEEGPWAVPYRAMRHCSGIPHPHEHLTCYGCREKILYVNADWRHFRTRATGCGSGARGEVARPIVGPEGPR
jgi:hypothetical protein